MVFKSFKQYIVQNLIKDYTKDDSYITITELLEFDVNGNFVRLTNTYNNKYCIIFVSYNI